MYIKQIELKNIRGFSELSFDLGRGDGTYAGWTVFTGGNGSGKSTLLKAVAIALMGVDHARSVQPNFSGWIREGNDKGAIELQIVNVEGDDHDNGNGKPSVFIPAKITMEDNGPETAFADGARSGPAHRAIWSRTASGWFSCGYGAYRRIFGADQVMLQQMEAPVTERYVTMFAEGASLSAADSWLRSLHHQSLEEQWNSIENPHEDSIRLPQTEMLHQLLEILRDDLLPSAIPEIAITSHGLRLKDSNGAMVGWNDMSDGYRSALALLTDIVRHLFATYGLDGLTDRGVDGRLFVKRSGVVLIDEIDAHLHPEWQREIGFWLKKHFPNIQFLVTSHSPIICQAADPNGLFVLPEIASGDHPRALTTEEYQTVIASRPDTILLSPAFHLRNTRSPRAVEARAAYARIRAKRREGIELTPAESAQEDALRPLAVTREEL